MWSPAAGSPPPILVRAVFRMYPKVVFLQETLRHHGFGPHQSDGHVLLHTCLRPAVPEDELDPDFADVGSRVTCQGGARRNALPKGDGTSRLLAFIMSLLENMGQNSYPPQAGTASKHPPVLPKSKKWNQKANKRATVTNDHHIQVHMQQCHKVKNSPTKNQGKTQQGKSGWRVTVRLPAAPHFLPVIGLGSIPGRCLLIQPVGSHRLVA